MTLTELETLFSQNNCIESPYQDENHKVYTRISDNVTIAKICISSTSLHLLDNVLKGEQVFNFSDPNNDATIKFCIKALAVSETHAQNYVTIHLDETTIAIVSKTLVAGFLSQPFNNNIVQTKIKDCIHHTRHRSTCTRTNAEQ